MSAVTQETKENASDFPYRVASLEFFFLLQRIDRLDEKLSAEITGLRQEFREEMNGLRQEFRGEMNGLRQEVSGVRGLIWTTLGLMLGALAITATAVVALFK